LVALDHDGRAAVGVDAAPAVTAGPVTVAVLADLAEVHGWNCGSVLDRAVAAESAENRYRCCDGCFVDCFVNNHRHLFHWACRDGCHRCGCVLARPLYAVAVAEVAVVVADW